MSDELCGACKKPVDEGHNALQCDDPVCLHWYHAECEGIDVETYLELKSQGEQEFWYCRVCSSVSERLRTEREALLRSLEGKFDEKVKLAVQAVEIRMEEGKSEREGLKRQVEELLVEVKRMKGTGQVPESMEVEVLEYLKEIEADLFSDESGCALVNCVAADMLMRQGVAAEFVNKFGGQRDLLRQHVPVGGVAFLQRERALFYLVSKEKSFNKPTLSNLVKCLVALRDKCQELNILKVAMPKIGAGLDGLKWEEVKKEINKIFVDSGVEVLVYTKMLTKVLVLGDDSLKEAVDLIEGAQVIVDEVVGGSTIASMESLLGDAPMTKELAEVVVYMGTCVSHVALEKGREEVRGQLKSVVKVLKEKYQDQKVGVVVVGAVRDRSIPEDVINLVNKILWEVCVAAKVKFVDPRKALSARAERMGGKWIGEQGKAGGFLGRFLSGLGC